MLKWFITAIRANKARKKAELSAHVRENLAHVLAEMSQSEQVSITKGIISASEIPKELIESLIKATQAETVVEITFKDGSTMRISGRLPARGGPGW